VLPKVGGSAASIEKQVKLLRAAGYAVDVVLVDLPPAETWRRMIGRFLDTGRIIPPDVMQKGIDGAPATYDLLKEKGVAHGYAKIDNSPARGEPRGIVEDDAGILPASIRGEIWAAERRGNGSDLGQARGGGARTGVEGTGRADPGLTEAANRLAAEYSDLEITMPDGATYSARDLLADLDTDAVTDAVLQGCAITPNTGD
jgi:hypothetical protein